MKILSTFLLAAAFALPCFAEQSGAGTVVTVSGVADVKANNDQAILMFFIEEQDKDKAVAASRVNQKIKSGIELIKKEDPQAKLTTRGYYSYPVYAEETQPNVNPARKRQQIGWRIGQSLEMKTLDLQKLAATTALVQKTLGLNGINFGLSDQASKNMEAARLEAGYQNFTERVAIIVKAMGRKVSDVTVESLDFDGGDSNMRTYASPMMSKGARGQSQEDVAETSFEPGESQLNIRVVGKIRIK